MLNKPLPIRGYTKKYSHEKKNFLESDSYSQIQSYMAAINERRSDIKTIIIDDFSFLMNNEFMRRCREVGFGKYTDMGVNMFDILESTKSFRPDLTCFIMCHTEKDHAGIIKPKTVGKMTADYVGISERVSIVLHTKIIDGRYVFMTQNDGVSVAKSPMDMFASLYIDNDLQMIKKAIESYYKDDDEEELILKDENNK